MNNTTIIQKLSELNYNGAKAAYVRQSEDINYQNLSFNERLYNLLESQEIYLANQKISMLQKLSKIKTKYILYLILIHIWIIKKHTKCSSRFIRTASR